MDSTLGAEEYDKKRTPWFHCAFLSRFLSPPKPPHIPSSSSTSRPFNSTAAAVVSVATTVAGIAVYSEDSTKPRHPFLQDALNFFAANRSLPLWGSLSLNDTSNSVVDSRTGVSFPSVLAGSRQLLGVGMRKKSILGLKNIDVYAFGVYADNNDIRNFLGEKYGKLSSSEITENKEFSDDLLESDMSMTVRLQIIYSKLIIRSVRSSFEESVGRRLRKFGGSDNGELLQRFSSQFKDKYKIPRESAIELARERGHVLRTTIDGEEVGSIESKLLCRSILDLYIGEEPFDKRAKEDVELNLASLLQK